MGINTRNMKLLAFAIGASFAGVAGVLFSAFQGFVSPESFTLWESIVVLAMVVLGGIGHIPGVILGAVLLAVFPEVLRGIAQPVQQFLFGHVIVDVEIIRQLIYGLALILIMLKRVGQGNDRIRSLASRCHRCFKALWWCSGPRLGWPAGSAWCNRWIDRSQWCRQDYLL
jgi:ABC-type branched-subunit amino acid transport system permease subunit